MSISGIQGVLQELTQNFEASEQLVSVTIADAIAQLLALEKSILKNIAD